MTKYLEVNNLSYSYPDGHEALKNISFDLDKKESLAISVSYTHLTLPTILRV